jgi:hypothetical protein
VIAACGGENRPGTGHTFRTVAEDGVTVAVNEGGPRYREELFDYELLLALQEDEREESLLFNPNRFLLGDDGRYYVADSGNDRIAVFDEQGRYHHAIGRRGSGPGEFRTFLLEEAREGVVTAFDLSNGTFNRFTTAGRLIESRGLAQDRIRAATIFSCRRLSGERLLMLVSDVNPQDIENLERFALRLLLKGDAGDTLWTVRTPEVKVMEYVPVTILGRSVPLPTPIPFGPSPTAVIATDGTIVVSLGLASELEVYSPGEGLIRRLRLGLPLEPPSEADRRSLEEGLRRSIANRTGPADDAIRQIAQAQLENLHYPEFKAPWGSLDIDENGAIWLETITGSAFAEQADTTHIFHVVSPEGEYLGLTTTPKAGWATPSRGRLLVRRTDPASGGAILEVYAIRPRVAGLVYP